MKSTTDVWFASFLSIKGHPVARYDVISRGKGKFFFNLSEEEWKKFKLEFNNSEIIKYKAQIEQLKDLCF